jgi:nitroimidazol reductase NimA-like FMN-containing flavoprotein (pyridoxamine 5'-phosphate oxidase superfamily)
MYDNKVAEDQGTYGPTDRTRVRRKPGRGSHDRELVHSVLDEALSCHLGFAVDGQPYVIPMIHARAGELLYLHGARASRALLTLEGGARCCVTVTLVDGLVLARSALHHSLNYRSVVVLGSARAVTDRAEKRSALDAIVEHIVPGRTAEARGPSEADLKATFVLAVPLEEVSAKVREGPPVDNREDHALGVWAGELPLATSAAAPLPDPQLSPDLPVPGYVRDWRRG